MRDLVPDQVMGRLFGQRQRQMIGVGIVFSESTGLGVCSARRTLLMVCARIQDQQCLA